MSFYFILDIIKLFDYTMGVIRTSKTNQTGDRHAKKLDNHQWQKSSDDSGNQRQDPHRPYLPPDHIGYGWQKNDCHGQAYEQGKHCIEINVNGKKALVTLPTEIYAEMEAELKAAKTFEPIDTSAEDAKDLADYLFSREMSNPNSDL